MPRTLESILPEVIEFTRSLAQNGDNEKLLRILNATKSFMYILDPGKPEAYKIAIGEEFVDEVANVMHSSYEVELNVADMIYAISLHVPVAQLTPDIVTFWLHKTCDEKQLRNMQSIAIYINATERTAILAKQATLRENVVVKALLDQIAQD